MRTDMKHLNLVHETPILKNDKKLFKKRLFRRTAKMDGGEVISLGPSLREKKNNETGSLEDRDQVVKPARVDKAVTRLRKCQNWGGETTHIKSQKGSWHFQKLHNATRKQK